MNKYKSWGNSELIERIQELEQKETNNKIIEHDRVILNTTHFATQVIETEEGVIIDIFHRHGDLIDTYTYWNDDVMDSLEDSQDKLMALEMQEEQA